MDDWTLRRRRQGGNVAAMPDDFADRILGDWPLHERQRIFELGSIIEPSTGGLAELAARQALGQRSAGWWECDLSDDRLTWTAGVYRIFGFPDGARVPRCDAIACYMEESRAKMERLRSYAVTARAAFVLDARIAPADGLPARWMRLIGTPVVDADGRITHLQGLKFLL